MPPGELTQLYDRFETDLSNEQYDTAEQTLEQIAELYADQTGERANLTKLARRSAGTSIEQRRRLTTAGRQSLDNASLRLQFLAAARRSLRTRENTDIQEVLDLLTKLRQSESDFDSSVDEVQPLVDNTELPAELELATNDTEGSSIRVPSDGSTDLSVQISNVGDQNAFDIDIATSGGGLLSVTPENISLGGIGPGETVSRTFSLRGSESGQVVLSIEAGRNNVPNVSISRPVVVGDRRGGGRALAAKFDDGNGEIEAREVLAVIAACNDEGDSRVQNAQTVLAVIAEYNGDGLWRNVA